MLDDRKIKILEALINDYIFTGEPVGSRTISKKYLSGISSATIRNDMADLEDLGYLEKPHTSAGRIPSDKGYRFYVDRIMKHKHLGQEDIYKMQNDFDIILANVGLENILNKASKVLSDLTNYVTLIGEPKFTTSSIQNLHIVKMNMKSLLIIVVSNTGIVKNVVLNLSEPVSDIYIFRLGETMNNLVAGLDAKQIRSKFDTAENVINGIPKIDLKNIIEYITNMLDSIDSFNFHLSGITNIFNFPEFNEMDIAKEMIDALDEKTLLNDILFDYYDIQNNVDNNYDIKIGKENAQQEFQKCSIVSSTYSIGDKVVGAISIIGPTRMDYSNAIAWIDYMSKYLTNILNTLYK